MKEKLKKSTALLQVIVMLITSVAMLFTVESTESTAFIDARGYTRVIELNNYYICVNNDAAEYGNVVKPNPAANFIEITGGASIKVIPKNKNTDWIIHISEIPHDSRGYNLGNPNIHKELSDTFEVKAWMSGKYIIHIKEFVNNIEVDRNDIFTINCVRVEGFVANNGFPYTTYNGEMVLSRTSNNYSYATYCVRANAEVQLGNTASGSVALHGHYGFDKNDNGFSFVSQNNGILKTPSDYGQSARINWTNVNGAGDILFSVFTSNLSNGKNTIGNLSAGTVKSTNENINGYKVTKRIGANLNKEIKFTAYPNPEAQGIQANANIESIEAIPEDGISNLSVRFHPYNTDISFTYKKPTILKVKTLNFNNKLKEEYWYVEETDTTVPINEDNSATPGKDYSNIGGGSSGGSYDGGSYDGGNYYGGEEYYDEPTGTAWYWGSAWDSDKQQVITYELENVNSDKIYWGIVKRNNENQETDLSKSYGVDQIDFKGGALGRFSINIDEQEEGYYDVIIYTERGRSRWTEIIDTVYMGGKYSLKMPHLSSKGSETTDPVSGETTVKYNLENCTAVKYKVVKREDENVPLDEKTIDVYDKFDGTEISDPGNELEIKINPVETGYGKYDVVVYGIYRAEEYKLKNNYVHLTTEVETNSRPAIEFSINLKESAHKQIQINTKAFGNSEIKERYYNIFQLPSSDTECKPTAELIKKGEKFEDGDVLDFTVDENGSGYFVLGCYVEDDQGRGICSTIPFTLSKTNIDFSIQGEEEGAKASITPRYVQTVDITAENEISDSVDISYIVTSKNFYDEETGKIDSSIFNSDEYEVKTATLNKDEKYSINIEAIEDKVADVYVYVLAQPKGVEGCTVMRTGSIRLDGTPLKLNSIYIEEENYGEETYYKEGDTFKVAALFNHELDRENIEAMPMLYLKTEDGVLVPYTISNSDNMIEYSYKVQKDTPNGTIEIDHMEYFGDRVFMGKGATNYQYKDDITKDKNVFDFISAKKYVIDTKAPEVKSIEFQIDADQSKITQSTLGSCDGITRRKVISDYNEIKMIVKYDEEVTGQPAKMSIRKGDKACFAVAANVEDYSEPRTQDEYILTDLVNNDENIVYEGDLGLQFIVRATNFARDVAGNEISYPEPEQYDGLTKYTLNGKKEEAIILFDSIVSKPEIYAKDEMVEDKSSYPIGTKFKVFAEFNSEGNWLDASWLTNTVEFKLYYTDNNRMDVIDNKGQVVNFINVKNSPKEGYDHVVNYTIDRSRLPITFSIENEGNYCLETEKEDTIGNKSSNNVEISMVNEFRIDRERSGLLYIRDEEFHCLNDMTEDEKTYFLRLHSDDRNYDYENVKVYIVDNLKGRIELKRSELLSDENGTEFTYKFELFRAGQYKIEVVRDNGEDGEENILTDFVTVDNVYVIGDVNRDGTIDSLDGLALLKYNALTREERVGLKYNNYSGNVRKTIDEMEKDYDGDPAVGVQELVYLLRVLNEDTDADGNRLVIRQSDKV